MGVNVRHGLRSILVRGSQFCVIFVAAMGRIARVGGIGLGCGGGSEEEEGGASGTGMVLLLVVVGGVG